MTLVCKFLHSKDLPSIMSGSFLFKRFDLFHDQVPPIGDPYDSRTRISCEYYEHKPDAGNAPLGPAFIFSPGAEGAILRGFDVVYESPLCWISCFSIGRTDELWPHFEQDTSQDYDAAVEIRDIEGICRKIWLEGCALDCEVQTNFEDLHFGPVIYQNIHSQPPTGYKPPSPFLKHISYRNQKEFRLALFPLDNKSNEIPKTFIVNFSSNDDEIVVARRAG